MRILGINCMNHDAAMGIVDFDKKRPGKILWAAHAERYSKIKNDHYLNQEIVNEVSARTGLVLDPYFSATKIKWILENVEGARKKANEGKLCFGTVDTYLMYVLSNKKIHKTDITNASRTMLFNINTLSWDNYLLELFNIPESMLPEVSNSDDLFGTLSECNNLDIRAVLGDQQAALFGQGCLNAGDLKSTYGTGGFLMSNIGLKPLNSDKGLLT